MPTYKKNYLLKEAAKDSLRGNYRSMILICLLISALPLLLDSIFSALVQPLIPSMDLSNGFESSSLMPAFLSTAAINLIVNLIAGFLHAGTALILLSIACGQSYKLSDVFYGFKNDSNKIAVLSFTIAITKLLFMSPFRYYANCYYYTGSREMAIKTVAALLIGGLLYLPIGLSLEISYFMLFDFPDKTAGELLSLCFQKMNGHKMRLFLLELSFIPLCLLGVLSIYVGFLWIVPYMQMTNAQFYLNLMNPENDNAA